MVNWIFLLKKLIVNAVGCIRRGFFMSIFSVQLLNLASKLINSLISEEKQCIFSRLTWRYVLVYMKTNMWLILNT